MEDIGKSEQPLPPESLDKLLDLNESTPLIAEDMDNIEGEAVDIFSQAPTTQSALPDTTSQATPHGKIIVPSLRPRKNLHSHKTGPISTEEMIAAIRGSNEDQIIEMGVATIRDLKRWLQSANKKLEATNRLRQYVAESMAKQRNLEMELVSAKSRMTELGNSNKVFQASI
ncbi:hypothetical protein AAG906_020142 [Vitis piasezkii]